MFGEFSLIFFAVPDHLVTCLNRIYKEAEKAGLVRFINRMSISEHKVDTEEMAHMELVSAMIREREIVHFQRFGEALRNVTERLDSKNIYAINPAYDKK